MEPAQMHQAIGEYNRILGPGHPATQRTERSLRELRNQVESLSNNDIDAIDLDP